MFHKKLNIHAFISFYILVPRKQLNTHSNVLENFRNIPLLSITLDVLHICQLHTEYVSTYVTDVSSLHVLAKNV